jgi:chorismate synthase
MDRIRFLTAGESHGQALVTVVEGLPAGLNLNEKAIERDMQRRQRGYGRGGRMKIEKDRARILSGVRYGSTLGSPVALLLENRDWVNWTEKMAVEFREDRVDALQMPRPGHADFAGMVKYRQDDLRNILERSSARETAMRVAVGAICRTFLATFGIRIYGHVIQIGSVSSNYTALSELSGKAARQSDTLERWAHTLDTVEAAPMACADPSAESEMIKLVDDAAERGDTLGGTYELVATGVPVGLGSHVHWDRRLDGIIAGAMLSINAMKSVDIGIGRKVADRPGSQVHDELFFDPEMGYYRSSNHAGGIEGGMTNGEPVVVRVSMKPLPTLSRPLQSVDAGSRQPRQAFRERSDVCAVPAAVVVGEAMLAIVLANALCEKLGGDSMPEMLGRFRELPHVPLGW